MSNLNKQLADRLYAHLPVSLQNVVFSGYGWRQKSLRYGKFYHQTLRSLRQSEWWSSEAIRTYQDKELAALVREAYEHVPYYNKLWRSLGIRPEHIRSVDDLPKLPLLDKQTVKKHQSELVSRKFDKRKLLSHLTSGTTGTPLNVLLTPEAVQYQWAVWWRHRARFGVQLGDRFLMFGARLPVPIEQTKPPYWRTNKAINQVYLSTYHIAPSTVRCIVDWLNGEEFTFYTGYPSAMYSLALLIEEQGLKITAPPRHIITGSDALLPSFEQAIQRVFGAPVTEQYGMVEACGNLAKCQAGLFHLDFEYCIMENLPIPGAHNSKLSRLVFTGLTNPAMPLIRYEVGDYANSVANNTCSCGRQSATVRSIDGRVEEYVRTSDGRRIMGLNQAFEWASGVKETQVVQNTLDTIAVKVLPGLGFDPSIDLSTLESEFRKRMGHEIRISFEIVDHIPRTSSGKYRAVISNLPLQNTGEVELRQAVNQTI